MNYIFKSNVDKLIGKELYDRGTSELSCKCVKDKSINYLNLLFHGILFFNILVKFLIKIHLFVFQNVYIFIHIIKL